MPPRPAPPRRPPGLDTDTVVTAALHLARTEGLAAVSMRRLADALGTTPMALYRHVADREDLLLRMLDVVADGVDAPPVTDPPRERIAAVLHSLHAAFGRDPWVVQVLASDGLASPRVLPAVDAVFGALADAGFSPHAARECYALLLMFAYGEILVSHHDPAGDRGRHMVERADPERFPHLTAVMASTGPSRRDHFGANLDRVLNGILGP